jgi:hypothetical protein
MQLAALLMYVYHEAGFKECNILLFVKNNALRLYGVIRLPWTLKVRFRNVGTTVPCGSSRAV